MGLEQYVINFILFVNGTVIPFLLGMAFLVFVINVFRFFIIGGANSDSQEKARALAIYGVGAFVLIVIFWGIVNILNSSLGLSQFATSDNTCFDYDPLCNDGNTFDQGPRSRPSIIGPAGDPVSAGPTTRPITPISNAESGPTTRPIVTNGTDLLGTGGPTTRPSIIGPAGDPVSPGPTTRPAITTSPGRVAEDVAAVASSFTPTEYGDRLNSVIQGSINTLTDPTASTQDRAEAAVLLESNGYISEVELGSYINVLNAERTQSADVTDQQPLDMLTIRSDAARPPAAVVDAIIETQSIMLTPLIENNRGFFDIGEPNQSAIDAAQAQLNELYGYTVEPPDRIAAFDILFSGNEDITPSELAVLRTRMIEDINAERFYAGYPPLSAGN